METGGINNLLKGHRVGIYSQSSHNGYEEDGNPLGLGPSKTEFDSQVSDEGRAVRLRILEEMYYAHFISLVLTMYTSGYRI